MFPKKGQILELQMYDKVLQKLLSNMVLFLVLKKRNKKQKMKIGKRKTEKRTLSIGL